MATFEQIFDLTVSAEDAWTVVSELELLVPCLPGASLDDVDGADFTGKVTVKVGPIQVKYRGRGQVAVCDRPNWTMTIEAKGAETSGTGTATATVSARLEPVDAASSRMHVSADYEVTGTPARFGNGVMAEVAERVVQKFATNLAAVVSNRSASSASGPADTARVSAPDDQLSVLDLLPAAWVRVGGLTLLFVLGVVAALTGARLLRIKPSPLFARSVDHLTR